MAERPDDEYPLRSARAALLEQIGRSIAGLRDTRRSDRTIHAIRKELKRARASLRLLRGCLGDSIYRRENARLRDAARPLTPVRDAKILFEALRNSDPHMGAPNPSAFMRRFYRVLGEQRRGAKRQLRGADLARAAGVLRALERRIAALPERRLARAPASRALKRAYKAARKAFADAERQPTDESLHEWRKQTKYLANELEVLLAFGPKRFAKSLERAQKLAEELGDDHDLALLTEKALRHATGSHAPSRDDTVQELLTHLKVRRTALQRRAFRLGRRLFADKPRRYEL